MDYTREVFLWQQTYATLFSVSNKIQAQMDKELGALTSRQVMALTAVIHLPKGGASLNAIAKKMGTTKQNTKQLVSAMERKGYVIIAASESDKRAYSVEMTEQGQRAFTASYMRGMFFFEKLFRDFSAEELEMLWSMLKKLYRYDGEEQDGFEEPADFEYQWQDGEVKPPGQE
ncbi:MAG: MarR family transcriptional regulator [Eubacteriaceae bacterium]|nr:MarR family transcriptional regulator [Eubacteriaceae bacterium]